MALHSIMFLICNTFKANVNNEESTMIFGTKNLLRHFKLHQPAERPHFDEAYKNQLI